LRFKLKIIKIIIIIIIVKFKFKHTQISMKPTFFPKFYFFMTGIAALIGWNSILTAFDFFEIKYPDYRVDFLMPLP